jgi:hypothetical protein
MLVESCSIRLQASRAYVQALLCHSQARLDVVHWAP